MGRQSTYTEDVATEVCNRLAAGESLRAICQSEHIPHEATVRGWVIDDAGPGFATRYARARDVGLDVRAEKVRTDFMDEPDTQRARLIFDHERWYLSKMAPKRYGDKLDVAVTVDQSFAARLAAAREPAPDADD